MSPRRHDRRRRSIRLRGYDYSLPGAYYLTLCARERAPWFGEIRDGAMVLNPYGEIVRQEWFVSAHVRSEIELDVYVIMPNHLHAIVIIVGSVVPTADWTGDHRSPLPRGPKNKSLGSLVAGFKAATTRRINELAGTRSQSVWQRNYYERIIRDDSELNRIRQYIEENPDRWRFDPDNPYVLESENH